MIGRARGRHATQSRGPARTARLAVAALTTLATALVATPPAGATSSGGGGNAVLDYNQCANGTSHATACDRGWINGIDNQNNSSYREGEVAYALGEALGQIYQEELAVAERISGKAERESRKKAIQTEYRDAALRALEQSRGHQTLSPEYLEALVAFYEKRYDDTVAKARAAYGRLPSLYEARALEASAHAAMAMIAFDHGQNSAGNEAMGKRIDLGQGMVG